MVSIGKFILCMCGPLPSFPVCHSLVAMNSLNSTLLPSSSVVVVLLLCKDSLHHCTLHAGRLDWRGLAFLLLFTVALCWALREETEL